MAGVDAFKGCYAFGGLGLERDGDAGSDLVVGIAVGDVAIDVGGVRGDQRLVL